MTEETSHCCSGGTCGKNVEVKEETKSDCCASGKCSKPVKEETKSDCCASGKCSKTVKEETKSDCCASGKCSKTVKEETESDCCASDAHSKSHSHSHAPTANLYKSMSAPSSSASATKTKPPSQPHGNPDCIAIVREDGDVDVYDVGGDCMTFRAPITADGSNSKNPKKLCFSSHGHDDIDRYLTPCFDEEGNLGDPEEDCHCGAEGPHLHAHLHNVAYCRDDLHANQKFQLASVTLEPKEVEVKKALPASASLPNACNSSQVAQSLLERGMDAQKYHASKQRLTSKISHEDHVDVLVHNPKTGMVTLEHDCEGCGNMDVHGTLAYAAQRSFHADEYGERKIQMNFYEIPKTPLRLLDVLSGFFALEDDKAHVMRSAFPTTASPTKTKPACCKDGTCTAKEGACPSVTTVASDLEDSFEGTVKSTLHVKGICCASEIPMVNSIVEPLKGVTNVSVVTTTKLVHVTHDPTLITAQEVMRALNKQKFNASVKKDGGGRAPKMMMTSGTTSGRSTFFVSGICCAAEIPAINNILEPLKGVQKVSINVPNKMVYVEHEFDLISAKAIKEALDQERFFSKVEKDAQAETAATQFMSKYVESTFLVTSLFEHTDAGRVKVSMREHFSKEQLSHSEVHIPSKTIKIDHNPKLVSADDLAKFLQDSAGLDVALIADGFKEGIWSVGEDDLLEEEHAHLQWSVIFSGIFWIVSMLHFIGGNWDFLKYAGILSVLLGIPGIASKAFLTMKRGQFDTNCMMLFATLGALGLQEYSEAAAVTFLFSISDWLETLSTARARNALSAIVKLRPERAKVKDPVSGKFVFVPASCVAVGSIVSVRTGDKIPCDGVVVEGSSVVDESSLTGESRPVRKVPSSVVSGGTINAGVAQLLVRTTSTADNSAVARLIRLVEDAQANRSPTEKLIDSFAKRYTPLVVLLAFSMCTFPWIVSNEVGREWTKMGLVTIVIACPCALIISTPVTYVAGLAAAAQRGIVVKGGAHLESLGRVKRIAFDKTGTLTEGNFKLLSLRTWGTMTREEVLQFLYCIEGDASHPLAAAMIAAAKAENVSVPQDWKTEDHQDLEGEGVVATINGLAVHVGNFRLFERLSYIKQVPQTEMQFTKEWLEGGGTVGFLSVKGHGIVASYCVADAVRKEAKDVIASFGKLGIDVNMLTGDNSKAALSIGKSVGLTETQIKSQLLPHEKLDLVTELMREEKDNVTRICGVTARPGLVLMCGDGVNDAPALAIADVGVAMGAGAALAMETADVTLLDSNLLKLLKVVKLGRRVNRTILENVAFSFVAKAVVMGFTFAGYSSLWAAIGSDVGAMLIVTMNGMKLLPSKKSVRSGEGFDSFKVRGNGNHESGTPSISVKAEGGSSGDEEQVLDGNEEDTYEC